MANVETEQQRKSTREFNLWVASLPRSNKVIGQYADGTEVTVEVPSLFI